LKNDVSGHKVGGLGRLIALGISCRTLVRTSVA
jgi:hypothetical protein